MTAGAQEADKSALRQAVEEAADLTPYTSESAAVYTAATFLSVNEMDMLQCSYYLLSSSGNESIIFAILLESGNSSVFHYVCQYNAPNGSSLEIYGEGMDPKAVNSSDLQSVGYTDSNAATQAELSDIYTLALSCMDTTMKDLGDYLRSHCQSTVHVLGFVNYNS